MKVRAIYHHKAVCADPWDTLRDAARKMKDEGISCLPILVQGELAGILTERDVVEAVAESKHPCEAHVVDFMTENPVTLALDDDTSDAATEMLARGCRHLPVTEGGRLVGMLSARDLLPLAAAPATESAAARA